MRGELCRWLSRIQFAATDRLTFTAAVIDWTSFRLAATRSLPVNERMTEAMAAFIE